MPYYQTPSPQHAMLIRDTVYAHTADSIPDRDWNEHRVNHVFTLTHTYLHNLQTYAANVALDARNHELIAIMKQPGDFTTKCNRLSFAVEEHLARLKQWLQAHLLGRHLTAYDLQVFIHVAHKGRAQYQAEQFDPNQFVASYSFWLARILHLALTYTDNCRQPIDLRA